MKQFLLLLVLLCTAFTVHAESQSGRYVWDFDLSEQKSTGATRLWVPYPVSDSNQLIEDIKWQGNFEEAAVYTEQKFGAPMLYVKWPEGSEKKHLQLSFSATRQEQIRREFPQAEGTFSALELEPYLAATTLGPTQGAVKKLADQITLGKVGILEKARAIYDWTVDNTYRDPNTNGCGLGDVETLLRKPGGKCVDISSIYIALARAAGVPSREIMGIRSGRKEIQDVTKWQHCWAEFYLPGYGWVPVDPADVRKAMLKQDISLDDPKVAELREDFWGRVDPYRIRLGEGRDLQLNPPQEGQAINYLMYPFAQVGGETLDWLDPGKFKYTITWSQ